MKPIKFFDTLFKFFVSHVISFRCCISICQKFPNVEACISKRCKFKFSFFDFLVFF